MDKDRKRSVYAATHFTQTTNSRGSAAVEVILGGLPGARYPIKATCIDANCINSSTNQPINKTINHYTAPFGNCSGESLPGTLFVLKTLENVDSMGNIINAGKAGTSMPVKAKIYFIREGQKEKNIDTTSLGLCKDKGLFCDIPVGSRTYTIDSSFSQAAVSFGGQPGAALGNGIYLGTYTLPQTPQLNTVTITGAATASKPSWMLTLNGSCTECTIEEFPLKAGASADQKFYGVDITVNSLSPILLDQWGYAANDSPITYTITPLDYRAISANVMIYKDGALMAAIPAERQGAGPATISRGFRFDVNSTYETEVVLNYGSGVEIRGEKKTIPIMQIQVKRNVLPDSIEEIKFGDGKNAEKTYHIKLQATALDKTCSSLTGRIRVVDKQFQPVTAPGAWSEFYPSEYPLNFELSLLGLGSDCLVKVIDTTAGAAKKGDFIVSNQSQQDLESGDNAILYGGLGNQLEVEIDGTKKYLPIEPVGVIVLGIDGLRQDVLYSPAEQQVNELGVNYYVQPAELQGLCDVLGGKYGGFFSSSCDASGWGKKHIKLPNVTAIFPSITLASWASIFTGKMPKDTGITGNEFFDRATSTMITLDDGAFPVTPAMLNKRFPVGNFSHAAGIGISDNLLQAMADDGSKVQTVYESVNAIKPGIKSVVMMHNYSRGAKEWHYQDNIADLLNMAFNGFFGDEKDVSKKFDSSPVSDTVDYIKNFTNSLDGNKKFPALMSIYLAGLDHYAHAFGLGSYIQFFKDNTDKGISDIVKALKEADEFNNKIFLIVADHGHTQMPTFADINLPDGTIIMPNTTCKL